MRQLSRLGFAPVALALVLASGLAAADPQLLTQREARETGLRCLRAGRFPEAVAAFAQADKCWPAPDPNGFPNDARSRIVTASFVGVWAEAMQAGKPDADRLPLAEFFVTHYPFFDTATSWDERAVGGWDYLARFAAETRRHQDDPSGRGARYDRCRALAALSDETGGATVLAWLEGDDWPTPHEDFGACALRAFRLLDRALDREPEASRETLRARVWAAYARRFAAARCFGRAAMAWGREIEAEPIATDPIALRWLRTEGMRRDLYTANADSALVRLGEVASPWVTPALVEAWGVVLLTHASEDPAHDQDRLSTAWRRLKERHAGTVEFGMASFAVFRSGPRSNWEVGEGARQEFLREWSEAAPQDPFLLWARWLRLGRQQEGDPTVTLAADDRATAEDLAARFPTESIGAAAELLLAEDDVRQGHGDAARRRYEAVARFDPEGVRLPAAHDPRNLIGAARERLIDYFRSRDPRRVVELSGNPIFAESPHFPSEFICGNAVHSAIDAEDRLQARRLVDAGLTEQAIERYWERLARSNLGNGSDEATIAFADLCVVTGRRSRISVAIEALRIRQQEETRAHPRYGSMEYEMQARRLEEYLAALDVATAEGAAGVARRLTELAAGMQWYRMERTRAFEAILSAASHVPRVAAEVPRHLTAPATAVGLMLARIAPGPVALDYALDVCLACGRNDLDRAPGALAALADEVLCAAPAAALRRIVERVRRDGPALWERARRSFRYLSFGPAWKTWSEFQDDVDPVVRDLARLELKRMRLAQPWLAYCQEGK